MEFRASEKARRGIKATLAEPIWHEWFCSFFSLFIPSILFTLCGDSRAQRTRTSMLPIHKSYYLVRFGYSSVAERPCWAVVVRVALIIARVVIFIPIFYIFFPLHCKYANSPDNFYANRIQSSVANTGRARDQRTRVHCQSANNKPT